MKLRRPVLPALGALGAAFAAVASTVLATGCAPAVVAVGVGATALVATDRRSTGAQVDDESIEFKMSSAAGSSWGSTSVAMVVKLFEYTN